MQRFLYRHAHLNIARPALQLWMPAFSGWIGVHASAKATYYAPSDLSGWSGTHREVIRSTGNWYRRYERRDTILVQTGPADSFMGGLKVARVLRFVSFSFLDVEYHAALVEWFEPIGNQPDQLTGMWRLRRSHMCNAAELELIPISSIARSCHLAPVFGDQWLPKSFHHSRSHVAFREFWLNHYSDYHAFETFPRS
jgi:hypothetical protein